MIQLQDSICLALNVSNLLLHPLVNALNVKLKSHRSNLIDDMSLKHKQIMKTVGNIVIRNTTHNGRPPLICTKTGCV